MQPSRCSLILIELVCFALFLSTVSAKEKSILDGTGLKDETHRLEVSRYPALYTGDFGDCMTGESLFNITKFDAAYYTDNHTLLFLLDGTTKIGRENVVLHLSVEAYGETHFNMMYDPCKAEIDSMCPLKVSSPVTLLAAIPISPIRASKIPAAAFGMPDLEAVARLRIFANSSQTEVGCFQAVMTNGNSFSQPQSVGTIIGLFTFFASVSSFATAVYGLSMPHMRLHYAHSLSVLVILETFQSIFFSGALSVDWPSVLPAWWSNFAWSAGMFASRRMIRSMSSFTGTSTSLGQVQGGGFMPISKVTSLSRQIYHASPGEPSVLPESPDYSSVSRVVAYHLGNPYDYAWSGRPQLPGLLMPGNWAGFSGTLAMVNVAPSAAFTLGLVWLLVALGLVVLLVVASKFLLDIMANLKLIKTDGFDYFRSHLCTYIAATLFRTLFIFFFAVMTLAMNQFSLRGLAGPTALAVITWLLYLAGIGGAATYACYSRLLQGKYRIEADPIKVERGKLFRRMPFVVVNRANCAAGNENQEKYQSVKRVPFFTIRHKEGYLGRADVHQDELFIKRFGWLSARYHHTRWWYFALYLGYLFVRACFIGGGARAPLAQVLGLFIFEIVALLAIIKLNPFEGHRNTAVAIWMLSVCKIVTTGLSIAFLPTFNIGRVMAAVVGIIIIAVQALLAIAILLLVVVGMVSSWMSLTRNREEFLEPLSQTRIRYFENIEARAEETPRRRFEEVESETWKRASFNVQHVRRAPKIEDEADDVVGSLDGPTIAGSSTTASLIRNRADSTGSRLSVSSLPRPVGPRRASWSSRDLPLWDAEMNRLEAQRMSFSRSCSLRGYGPCYDSNVAGSPARKPPMSPAMELFEDAMLGGKETSDSYANTYEEEKQGRGRIEASSTIQSASPSSKNGTEEGPS